MAYEELYDRHSSWTPEKTANLDFSGPDTRDLRDPETIGKAILQRATSHVPEFDNAAWNETRR